MIGAGFLALLPFSEEQALAKIDNAESSSVRCGRHAWLQINHCLSRRVLPWMTEHTVSVAAPLEMVPPEAQLIPDAQQAPMWQDYGERALLQSGLRQSTGDQPVPVAPMIESPQIPTKRAVRAEPIPDTTPTPSPATTKRQASKSAIEAPTGPIAPKATKRTHRDRQRKPSAAEDLQQHPNLHNKPQPIPISSYSATERREPL